MLTRAQAARVVVHRTARRQRRRARILALRGGRVLRRHYLSGLSLVILGVVLSLVFTSDSFGEREPRRAAAPPQPSPGGITATANVSPLQPARVKAVIILLASAEQRREIENAVRTAAPPEDGVIERVVYLVAGTPEEESEAIARLNLEGNFADQNGLDLTVLDLRPGSGFP